MQTERWKERSLQNHLTPEDLQITDRRYGMTLGLRRCQGCSFIFSDDQEIDELVSLYEQLNDEEYLQTQESRLLQMQWLLRRARSAFPNARTLLDIGAGAGLLLGEAQRQGLDAVGVEPSCSLVEAASRLHRLTLFQERLPTRNLPGGSSI